MKILIAADGSGYTKRAVEYVVRHMDVLGANPEIHIAHVQPPLPGRATSALGGKIVRDYYLDESGKAMEPALRILKKAGVPYRERALVGDPATCLAAVATSGKFDLLVMGSHGYGALRNLVLGSVASKVLAKCAVPVLIIR